MNTKIQILSNIHYTLADVIKGELLDSSEVHIAVAFLRKTGIQKITKALDYALNANNAKVEIIVGLDFKTTDYNALMFLNELKYKYSGFMYYCFGDKRENFNELIFHPKIYLFTNNKKYTSIVGSSNLTANKKYTSIVGSSNLTAGGLMSNFEVNTIFREEQPIYYSQLKTIYNEIKFTESIFIPSKSYLKNYKKVRKNIDRFGKKLAISKTLKSEVEELRKESEKLPGTVSSLKKLIIEIIQKKQNEGLKFVSLQTIYEKIEKVVKEKKLNYKMDTFRNTIRGELNKHEQNSKHMDNMSLFVRSPHQKGYYSLTNKARNYEGR